MIINMPDVSGTTISIITSSSNITTTTVTTTVVVCCVTPIIPGAAATMHMSRQALISAPGQPRPLAPQRGMLPLRLRNLLMLYRQLHFCLPLLLMWIQPSAPLLLHLRRHLRPRLLGLLLCLRLRLGSPLHAQQHRTSTSSTAPLQPHNTPFPVGHRAVGAIPVSGATVHTLISQLITLSTASWGQDGQGVLVTCTRPHVVRQCAHIQRAL
jgi:hypothetical protein